MKLVRAFRKIAFAIAVATSSMTGGLVAVSAVATEAHAETIVVRGNQRVDADTVRAYFGTGPLDAVKIDDAVKNLFATGLFQDVRVSREGGRVVVTVVENAVINRVIFRGNKKAKDATLSAEVESKPRGPYSEITVQSDVQRIQEIYRRLGRFEATVNVETQPVENGRVDVIFNINEGERTGIAEINFEGNNAYSDGRLRDVMSTTESTWLSWLKSSDIYDPDKLNSDLEAIRRFYLNHGYADFRVVNQTADLDPAKNKWVINITVEEGERYTFGQVDVESNVADVDAASLRSLIKTSSGATYSAELVEKSVEAMTLDLANSGYAFAQVRPRGSRNYEAHTIDVAFVVDEGARVYVERINVRGNTRTRDYVIRREFDLAEGDAYNQVLLDRAERRLKALGYFSSVKISTEPGSAPDRVVVNVDVADQATGEFSVAAGYSTSDGIIGEVSVAEKNFLGRGQYVRVAASWGEKSDGFEFNFTEPYFLGMRIAAGFDAFTKSKDQTDYSSYEYETQGGTLRAAFPITEDFTIGVKYSAYTREITIPAAYKDNDFSNGEASNAIRQIEGDNFTSLVGYSLVYSTLDNRTNPTNGLYAELRQDIAGLGGDVNYLKTTAEARYYYEVYPEIVAMAKVQGGHVVGWGDDNLNVLDHFFKGPDLVRGFEPSGIGPRDLYGNQDPLGGTMYAGATLELTFPLSFLPKELGLKGAVFADAGTLFDYEGDVNFAGATTVDCNGVQQAVCVQDNDGIRSSVGASIIWNSPFGPLRFDYAYALTKEDGDQTQAFRFSGGGKF